METVITIDNVYAGGETVYDQIDTLLEYLDYECDCDEDDYE